MYVGVDGFKSGWVALTLDDAGVFVAARCSSTLGPLVAAHAGAKIIGVDMPLGLIDGPCRHADQAARKFLRGNASSVFNAPVVSALNAGSYEEARAISTRVCGKSLSAQSYNILGKIRELDAEKVDPRLHEVHPEVSFRVMNGGAALPSKKTWGGLQVRLSLLKAEGIIIPGTLGDADRVGIDDVVDAAAAAWSARRVAKKLARRFPERTTQEIAPGRPIAIWA